jgi:RimJ/RimL family protein N-acetyltransferase
MMPSSFPQLQTRRLSLRRLQVEDVDALVKYANNRKISEQVLSVPHPYSEPDAVFRISYVLQGFKAGLRFVFAIISKERQELIGEVALHIDGSGVAQLGYWIGEPFWNNGFATEAVEAILHFGFGTLELETVYANVRADNKASEKVLLKCGMSGPGAGGLILRYALQKCDHEICAGKRKHN